MTAAEFLVPNKHQNVSNPYKCSGIILCVHPANERLCYIVTSSLIGLAHTQNDPCMLTD